MEPTLSRHNDSRPAVPLEDAQPAPPRGGGVLGRQLAWIVNLRWLAGSAVIAGGMTELFWLHIYGTGREISAVGLAILLYNILFWTLVNRRPDSADAASPAGEALWMVWGQMLADLASLTVLVALTGGYASPLRGLFVLHMVFASLLLPGVMALGMALMAIGMVEGVLAARGMNESMAAVATGLGWDVTMLATVYLAGRVARDLRRQGRRLARRNARIRHMAARLRQQQTTLVQAEKMFALGQMAAGVAHEVANPLASMDGLLQLMERRPEKVTAESMTRLREQIARINAIVRQLTTFARPETAGSTAEEWRQENLNAVVTRALEVLRFDDRLKRVAIQRELDAQLPPIRMLPAALEQVLINLVINAADALEAVESPRLTVQTRACVGGVELLVSDNGAGISQEIRGRIFEPFFTTKSPGKGTGLGLSISYSLIKKHNGEIQVESKPGEGTVFRVRLPAN